MNNSQRVITTTEGGRNFVAAENGDIHVEDIRDGGAQHLLYEPPKAVGGGTRELKSPRIISITGGRPKRR